MRPSGCLGEVTIKVRRNTVLLAAQDFSCPNTRPSTADETANVFELAQSNQLIDEKQQARAGAHRAAIYPFVRLAPLTHMEPTTHLLASSFAALLSQALNVCPFGAAGEK